MARKATSRKGKAKNAEPSADGNGVMGLVKELWQAAVNLRGSIEPPDYKRYVLPIIFLRFLSLRYERRREELEKLIADPKSDYYGDKKALNDPDEYRGVGAFLVPEQARWETIVRQAEADDIKVRLDDILELLETKYPAKLRGLLPRIYGGSNLDAENVRGLIRLFSKDIFKQDHGGADLIGRVYEYYIGEFASSEGKRGGDYFTPVSIVRLLTAAEGCDDSPRHGGSGCSGCSESEPVHHNIGPDMFSSRGSEPVAEQPEPPEQLTLGEDQDLNPHAGNEAAAGMSWNPDRY